MKFNSVLNFASSKDGFFVFSYASYYFIGLLLNRLPVRDTYRAYILYVLVQSNICSMYIIDILFCQITTFIKLRVVFVLGLRTLWLKDFTKFYQLKGLKPKNKGHMNFYECCDLTEKVYLKYMHTTTPTLLQTLVNSSQKMVPYSSTKRQMLRQFFF